MIKSEELMEEIMRKAQNNRDGEVYIKPGDFGFSSLSGGTKECADWLKEQDRIKSVKIDGKNLLLVQVNKQYLTL